MGARGVVVGVALLVVVGGGAVVADRVAVGMAEDAAAREVQAYVEGVIGEPDVQIHGFPFLTQVLAGRLDRVTARADGLVVDGVELTDVDIVARGIGVDQSYTVDDATLTGTLSVASAQRLLATQAELDVDLAAEGDRLLARTTVLGVDLTAALAPRAQDGRIRIDVTRLTLGPASIDVADLPRALEDQLTDLAIPIEGLPEGIALTGADVRDGAIRLSAAGADLVVEKRPGSGS
ncbi:DUF2993 domain-containing protein [Cellulomonas fimi]|uniref:DUF2993 domain-containing protein n=1 Tax=Cellulomonas fimi TaxID=1708 RepID=A0A7Y0QIH3_CELFI|nr:DUF2993 domain-containing protein [Cellulomonas fimi]NMR20282.1 DUF2993 domain-containing protein [Cellulomonas fimi]